MRRALLTLAFAVLAIGADTVPQNPIELSTEVGTVATRFGKATIIQKARITAGDVTFTTTVSALESSEYRDMDIETDLLPQLRAALVECIADKQKKPVGDITITSSVDEGKTLFEIRQKTGEFEVRPHYIDVDADNAELLVMRFKKAEAIRDWMKEKAPALQK